MMDLHKKVHLKEDMKVTIDGLQWAAAVDPSRELSLAITNAQQAYHWLNAIPVEGDE